MSERVNKFFEEKLKQIEEMKKNTKEKQLIDLGLFDYEYKTEGDTTVISSEYRELVDGKACRKKAIEVTDEEYEKIVELAELTYSGNQEEMSSTKQKVLLVKALKLASILAIATGLIDMISYFNMYQDAFSGWNSFLNISRVIISSFARGAELYGLAVVIDYLYRIYKK